MILNNLSVLIHLLCAPYMLSLHSMYNLFDWLQATLKGLKMAHNPSLLDIHLQRDLFKAEPCNGLHPVD